MTTDTIVNIPLNKLVLFDGNVRKTHDPKSLDELAASIKAHGLKQNLVTIPQGKKFAVVAGGRRLRAFWQLAEAGDIKATHLVPCKIEGGDIDPSEISLLENVMRENMHPADQFEAFRDLVDKGTPVPDIAARFGVTDTVVMQRLKLARVSPKVLKAYRAEKLTLEQVMAFAVSDDHAAQDQVLENVRLTHGAGCIREALTENEIFASDRRVKFVTLKAYKEAGGATRSDLFGQGEDSEFILDAPLLERLVTEKLQRAAKPIAKEGWKWIEARPAFDYDERTRLRRIHAEPAPLPAKLAAKVAKLEQELEPLRDQWHEADEDAEEPPRIDKIERQLKQIMDGRGPDVWTPEQLAMAGVFIYIGDNGKTSIERGLVRPEDWKAASSKGKGKKKANGSGETEAEETPLVSAALVEHLTAHRSSALSAELQQRPDIALAAVVHAFAACIRQDGFAPDSSLRVTATPQSLRRVEGSKAFKALEEGREKWERTLPRLEADLWKWCLEQKQSVLLELLAYCVGRTINAVRHRADGAHDGRLQHADWLAAALKLDMRAWFTPDAANYFSRVSKPQILDAIREAKQQPPAPAWEKLKKDALAQEAERQTSGTGWLPELLRASS